MTKELTIQELANIAAGLEDQTKTVTHTDYEIIKAGPTFGRFIAYIELGKQPQRPYQGKAKPDAEEVRLVFELLHAKKNRHEYEVNGEQKVRYDQISLRMAKGFGDKAKYKKLFNSMARGREDKKHMAQMLGEAFCIDVFHNEVAAKGDQPAKTFVNIYKDGVWAVKAPRAQPDIMNDPDKWVDIPVPAPQSPLQLFLWNKPTKATWDSLYIDGTRTVKKGDVETEVSKNWLQETIVSAKNYAGSLLDQLLGDIDLPMGGAIGDEVIDDDDDEREALKAEPAAKKPVSEEFEMTSDKGEEVPFVPYAPTDTQKSVTTASAGAAVESVSSPSEPDEEAVLMAKLAKARAAKAAAAATTVAPAEKPATPAAKASVDEDIAALFN